MRSKLYQTYGYPRLLVDPHGKWRVPGFNMSWRLLFALLFLALLLWQFGMMAVERFFPRTQVVVMNATEQELRDMVIQINGDTFTFDTIPAGDYASITAPRHVPPPGFRPTQQGTLADGTPIRQHGLSIGDRTPIRRAVYTVNPDGTQFANLESSSEYY